MVRDGLNPLSVTRDSVPLVKKNGIHQTVKLDIYLLRTISTILLTNICDTFRTLYQFDSFCLFFTSGHFLAHEYRICVNI